jgi:hypothetical protein
MTGIVTKGNTRIFTIKTSLQSKITLMNTKKLKVHDLVKLDFDENDVNVIIKGLRQILFHFMNIENPIYNLDKV